MGLLRKLIDVGDIPREKALGDIPSTKDIYRVTLGIAWPAIVELVLSSLISMADMAMVGVLGPHAITAVGINGQPRMIVLAVFVALNVGTTAIVARSKGEADPRAANLAMRQALMMTTALTIVLSIAAVPLAEPLLRFAGAKDDVIDLAVGYFRIIMLGLIFNTISLSISGAQRGTGNTRIALFINLTANVVNVIFNWLLISGNLGFPALGVNGAAIATVIGFVVAFVIAIWSLRHKDSFLRITRHDNWRPNFGMLRRILKVGGNAALEQLGMRIGMFAFSRIVADLGTIAFATHQICMQLLSISFSFADGLSVTATSLVGQNLGRKRSDMSLIYGKACQRLAFSISCGLIVVFLSLRYPLMRLFTSDVGVIADGMQIMILVALIQPFQTSQAVFGGGLRGAGDTKFVAIAVLISVGIIRPGLALVGVYLLDMGIWGAWMGVAIDQILRFIALSIRFAGGKWMSMKV